MKQAKVIALVLAVAALVIGFARPGSAASTVSQSFLLTGPGITSALSFSGQLQCEVQINGPLQSVASTPQYSADGVTWFAASNINQGTITTPGTFISSSQPSGFSSLRLKVSSFSGTQLSGQLVCGDSLPAGGGAGGVASVQGSPPITSSGGQNPSIGISIGVCLATDGIVIYYSCATPGPQATPSPTVTATACAGSPTSSGTYPYTLSIPAGCQPSPVPSPQVTATACAASPGISGAIIEIPAGCSSGSTNTFWSTILADPTTTHAWEMTGNVAASTPGPCVTGFPDAISGGATAAPSPVPMALATGTPQCAAPGLIADGKTSAQLNNQATPYSFFSVNSAAYETICKVGGGACNLAHTVGCLVSLYPTATYMFWFSSDQTTGAQLDFSNAVTSPLYVLYNGGSVTSANEVPVQTPVWVVFTFDGTHVFIYANGVQVATATTAPAHTDGQASNFGGFGATPADSMTGRMEKCFMANTAWSQQKILQYYLLTGLNG